MSQPEQTTVIDPARQIRVRTSTGWANLVIQGPPGYPDTTGHAGQVLTVPTPAGPPIWSFVAGLPAGGALGTVLTKKSAADFDTAWSVVQGLPADTVVPAATRIIANKLLATDTQNAWNVMGDGSMHWGAGGTTAADTTLQRLPATGGGSVILNMPNGLSTGAAQGVFGYNAVGAGTYQGPGGTFGSVRATTSGYAFSAAVLGDTGTVRWSVDPTGKLTWADGTITNPDTNLYRNAAGSLGSSPIIVDASSTGAFRAQQAAGNTVIRNKLLETDAQSAFYITGTGQHWWGPGGATAPDTTLLRAGPAQLQTNELLAYSGSGQVYSAFPSSTSGNVFRSTVNGEALARFTLWWDGRHNWGPGGSTATDTNLYRSSAGQLGTDGTWVSLAPSSGATGFWRYSVAANGWFGISQVQGEANYRWGVDVGGRMNWGPGGSTAADTNLYRYFANALRTDGGLYVGTGVVALGTGGGTGFYYNPNPAGGWAVTSTVASDANSMFALRYDGLMRWGPGGATAFDCNLQRNGAKQLMVGGGALPTSLTIMADNTVWPFVMYDAGAATQPYFRIENTGTMRWGDKTNPADTTLYRSSASVLATDGQLTARNGQAGMQVIIGNAAGRGAGLIFDTSTDTYLYRSAANTLKTDGAMQAVIGFNAVNMGGAGYSAYQASVSGDTSPRFIVNANGTITWGPGNAANDTTLYRWAAGFLGTPNSFGAFMGTTSQLTLQSYNNGPIIYFGNAQDTNLYRSAANQLRTGGSLVVDGLVTPASLGAGARDGTRFLRDDGTWQLAPAAAGALPSDIAIAAGTRIIRNLLVGTDAQPGFQLNGDGRHLWGPGGSTVPDTNLYRRSAAIVGTDSAFQAGGSLAARLGASSQVALGDIGGGLAGLTFGSANDTNLYRPAAGYLRTDTNFQAGKGIDVDQGGTGAPLRFGSAGDTNLYRRVAGQVMTDGYLIAGSQVYSCFTSANGNGFVFNPTSAAGNALVSAVQGEAQWRFWIDVAGTMHWGPGGSTGADTVLNRGGAGTLALQSNFVASGYYSANNGNASTQILLWNDGTIRLRGTPADVIIRGVAAGQLATDQCFSVGPGTRGGNQANEYTIAIYKSNISVVPNVGGVFGVLYVGSDNRLYYVDPTGVQRAIG